MSQHQFPASIAAMLAPSFYPNRPESVQLIQTQMSFVFLAGEFVYKVKKPVNLGYLDYSTLDKRRLFCQRELELNRRLCSEGYLDVIPITVDGGRYGLGGGGETVEYAVKMRNLPAYRMLSNLISSNSVPSDAMQRIAARVAGFHSQAQSDREIDAFGSLDTITKNTEENFDQTASYVGQTITKGQYQRVREYARSFIRNNAEQFAERIRAGRIRDCHGDLHAAHVCLTDTVCIFDCIEFNDRFRYGDVASEVAFLAMDLDHSGRSDLAQEFVGSYVKYSGDAGLRSFLAFYKCYRAYVRAKVEGFKSRDSYVAEDEKERATKASKSYYRLASFFARSRPTIFVTVGVTGSGKSTLADGLSRNTGARVISSDVVRKELAGIPVTEHRFDDYGTGLYSKTASTKTYDTMLGLAERFLASGESVILDASFVRRADRAKVQQLATTAGADLLAVVCRADETLLRERLRARANSVSDGREDILGPQLKDFEPPTEMPVSQRAEVNMTDVPERNVEAILSRIGES